MIREIVVPENNTYLLKLPDEMVGKEVEVIAFEVSDKKEEEVPKSVLAKEYADSNEENKVIMADFINIDKEHWDDY